MSDFRLSVSGVILLVAASGIGLAALTSPTAEMANALFTMAGACLLFALLAIVYRRGARRAFWAGFATFGWGYLIACYAPLLGPSIRPRSSAPASLMRSTPRMNPALEDTLREIAAHNPDWAGYRWHIRFDQEEGANADSVALTAVGQKRTTQNSIPFYPPAGCTNLVWFRKSAHVLVTLWVAFFGGLAGRYLEASGAETGADRPMPPIRGIPARPPPNKSLGRIGLRPAAELYR